MAPQEKAKELVDKFSNIALLDSYEAKLCALIAVDEMIKELDILIIEDMDYKKIMLKYWHNVKQEIEKL
jgi:hypothetical protein